MVHIQILQTSLQNYYSIFQNLVGLPAYTRLELFAISIAELYN